MIVAEVTISSHGTFYRDFATMEEFHSWAAGLSVAVNAPFIMLSQMRQRDHRVSYSSPRIRQPSGVVIVPSTSCVVITPREQDTSATP